MFYTYIIQSESTNNIYIGQTADIIKRIGRHNSGGSKSTKGKGPWSLLYYFQFQTRSDLGLGFFRLQNIGTLMTRIKLIVADLHDH